MKLKIAAWHDRDDRVWYPARWLDPRRHAGRALIVQTGIAEVEAKLDFHKPSGRFAWLEWRPALGEFVVLAPWRRLGPADMAQGREPVAFVPLHPGEWPELPEPLLAPKMAPAPLPELAPPPEPAEVDDWPYPGLKLGSCTPPRSLEECEARVLRALRTMDGQPRVGIAIRSIAADIPSELYYLMRRQQMADDLARLRENRKIDTDLKTVRIAFTLLRRDWSDWDYALDWYRGLSRDSRELIRMRAENPPFTWRQIGRHRKESHETSRRTYEAAIASMYRAATAAIRKDRSA